ncbi:BOC [Mytilus coruscus]|uniref:BOC n=1 Tax=Mytilus coruscus TaxID=42192 RepID=A0A6J8EA58_MYTCO|nr:BOC [Mytilus coruscus]
MTAQKSGTQPGTIQTAVFACYKDLIFDHEYELYDDGRLIFDEGFVLRFECIAFSVPEPKVVWKKKGNDNFISVGPLLDVPSVTKADSGFYNCEADNGIGDPVKSTELEVKVLEFFPPEMKYNSEPVMTITEELNIYGSDVVARMEVLVNGFPPPTVTWWRDIKLVPTATGWKYIKFGRERIMGKSIRHRFHTGKYLMHRVLISEDLAHYPETETKHMLTINLNLFELGTYYAKAENSLGVGELNFTINGKINLNIMGQ